jgi:DNA (cytosine-5)-methyltransferase 1
MVNYTCEKCGKEFTQKGQYTKHLDRKTPCAEHHVQVQVQVQAQLKYIDLFCGIGSFHHSFQKLGWECVMACDIDKAAKETYEANYGLAPLGDITEIEPQNIPAYDILCAGFPCQPFSNCGQHKGFDDKRGTMFFNIMKFVEQHNPSVLVLENVQGLLSHDGGKTFKRISEEIQAAGYTITYKVLKCSDYGLPQMRKRLIIVGVRNDTALVKHLDKLLVLDEYKKEMTMSTLLGKNFEKNIAYTIRCGGKNSPIDDKHNWDGYYVDGDTEYRLTKEDCLKLQGFEPTFKLCGNNKDQWKQLGNTIPTIFTELIGKQLAKYWL